MSTQTKPAPESRGMSCNFHHPAEVKRCSHNETGLWKVVVHVPAMPPLFRKFEMKLASTGDRETAEIIAAALTAARKTHLQRKARKA